MAINYPGSPPGSGVDSFTTPSNPEGTPLGEAGDSTRDMVELVGDEGLAIEQLEQWAALRTHDHSGDGTSVATGGQLSQVNTHQNADTDLATTSIHHTIDPTGASAVKAAAANHVHLYSSLPDRPYFICTSTTRPSSPELGWMITETDTNYQRVWADVNGVTAWHLTPMVIPSVQLQQAQAQALASGGTLMQWHTILADNDNFFNPDISLTDITINDGGLYLINAAIQWSSTYCPDQSVVVLNLNGSETSLRSQVFQRGNEWVPGFSQTLQLAGQYRFSTGDIVQFKVDYQAATSLLDDIETFFADLIGPGYNADSYITSTCSITYLSP